MAATEPTIRTEIIPYIFYRDVPAALDWLARAFGFAEEMRHPTPGGMHAQMIFGGQRIMMGQAVTKGDWSASRTHRRRRRACSSIWPMSTRS